MSVTRNIAAHVIETPQGCIDMGVVRITDGEATSVAPLHGEQEATEWLGGTIKLMSDGDGRLRAYHKGKQIE